MFKLSCIYDLILIQITNIIPGDISYLEFEQGFEKLFTRLDWMLLQDLAKVNGEKIIPGDLNVRTLFRIFDESGDGEILSEKYAVRTLV
jgi:hypothetical protein